MINIKSRKFIAISVIIFSLIFGVIYFNTHYAIIDKKLYRKDITYLDINSVDDERFREINKCTEIETLLLSKSNKHYLHKLINFHKLRKLVIMSSNINKIECGKISSFSSLEDFNIINYTTFDFEGFNNKTVSRIWIYNSSAKNIESLANCISLKKLRITESTISDNCIVIENLAIDVDKIEDISGILDMNSLETFYVNKDSISEENVKLLEDKDISIIYCGENE